MGSHEFGLFGRSIAGVDCPGRGKCTRGYNMCGTCYRIFGRGHRGHIWVYDGGSFSIVRYKVAFTEDSVLDIHIPGAFIISRFQNRFTGKNFAIRTFCNCEGSEKKFSFCKGENVKGTEIILTNDFCNKLCCTNTAFCNGMCRQISQSQDSPLNLNLVRIFNQINSCNFHATAARIYLESKVLEMFALFTADCKEGTLNESADTTDGETFGVIIRGYIESNYKKGLSVDTLAKFACMSASKFKAEFKKTFRKVFRGISEK
jgi:hypothetical protein